MILDGFIFESIWNIASSFSLVIQNRSSSFSNVQVKVLQPICSLPGKNSSLPLQFPLNSEKKFFCNSPRLQHSPTPSHFLRPFLCPRLLFSPSLSFFPPSYFILFFFFSFLTRCSIWLFFFFCPDRTGKRALLIK